MDTATATTRTITNAPPQRKLSNGMASRIPASLQAIFLTSNQGTAIRDAPLNRNASMDLVRSATIAAVLESNRQPILLSSPSGSNNSSNKNSEFTVTKKRIPTKLALVKPDDKNKKMVRNW
jgi:hypothetical protein